MLVVLPQARDPLQNDTLAIILISFKVSASNKVKYIKKLQNII
jgi:hypothetical protein